MEICLPLRFTKKTNKNLQLDGQMMRVNNFFGHWFIDIDIRRYPDDLGVLQIILLIFTNTRTLK